MQAGRERREVREREREGGDREGERGVVVTQQRERGDEREGGETEREREREREKAPHRERGRRTDRQRDTQRLSLSEQIYNTWQFLGLVQSRGGGRGGVNLHRDS